MQAINLYYTIYPELVILALMPVSRATSEMIGLAK